MDDPAPAAPADDDFDAFQGAPAPSGGSFDAFQSAPVQSTVDPGFDAFQSAPQPTQQPGINNAFDAFQSAPTPSQQQPQFDAFGGSAAPSISQPFNAFVSNGDGGNMSNMNNAFGNMSMGVNNIAGAPQQQMMRNVMGGSQSSIMGGQNVGRAQARAVSASDDDFGDFDDGKSNKGGGDPLSNLISLDGLTKNSSKNVDKTNEPVLFNNAAKAYMQSGAHQRSKPVTMSKAAADMAFSGVDGLHKQTSFSANVNMNPMNSMGSNIPSGQSSMNSVGNSNISMMNGMGSQMASMQQQSRGVNMSGFHQQGNMMVMNQGMNMNNGMSSNMGGQGMMGMGGMNMMNNGMNQQGNMMGMNKNQINMNNGLGGMDGMNNNMNPGVMGGNSMSQGNNTMGGQPMGRWQ